MRILDIMLKSQEKKRVHWQENHEQKENSYELLPQFKKYKQKLNFNRVKNYILDALRKKEYDNLNSWLFECFSSNVDRDSFFSKEGHHILKYIFAYSEELSVFDLLTNWFSVNSIKSALKNDNYDAIREFFAVQHGEELFDSDNELNRKIRVEKFKFLLQVAEKDIKEFIRENHSSGYMTTKIKQDFDKAIHEKKEINFRL